MPDKLSLGRAIRMVRTRRGLSQSDLARRAGVSTSLVSLVECGKRDTPFETLLALAEALGVPLSILVFIAGDGRKVHAIDDELASQLSALAMRIVDELAKQEPGLLPA
jgi:transcriptional regulator with XRE-family HTH domain